MTPEEMEALHARIVDQLRRQGWDRLDAIEEADVIVTRRAERDAARKPEGERS